MIIEIKDKDVRSLYIAAQEKAKKAGKGIDDILIEIIFEYKKNVMAAIEGLKMFYAITSGIELSEDDWENEEGDEQPGEIIPFQKDESKEPD